MVFELSPAPLHKVLRDMGGGKSRYCLPQQGLPAAQRDAKRGRKLFQAEIQRIWALIM
ncbi:hypothetical protein [Nostoc sp.]|uniref:hypothetical protein n=1 Tax=Nostoc sp. TaxID=1180 RepID=UPI002FF4A39F